MIPMLSSKVYKALSRVGTRPQNLLEGESLRVRSLGTLVLLGVLLSGQGTQISQSNKSLGISYPRSWLVKLVGDQRLAEGRLVGGFGVTSTASFSIPPALRQQASEIARDLSKVLDQHPSAGDWADLGVLYLVDGKLIAAISALEKASTLEPHNVSVLSDLGVVYIENAIRNHRTNHLLRGLEVVNRALALAPTKREALFTRAVALEKLNMFKQAELAWSKYLLVENSSNWLEEGRLRLNKLQEMLDLKRHDDQGRELEKAIKRKDIRALELFVDDHYRQARIAFETQFLGEWIEAALKNDKIKEGKSFGVLRTIAHALEVSSGDSFAKEVVQHIEILRKTDPYTLRSLVSAIVVYQKGINKYSLTAYSEALSSLRFATGELEEVRSPFALRSRFYLAFATHYTADYDKALDLLGSLELQACSRGYRSICGEVFWMKGLTFLATRRPVQAGEAYLKAREVFISSGDVENRAGIENLLAELLDFQGASSDAWLYRHSVLSLVSEIPDPQRLYQVYTTAAISAFREGLSRTAVDLQQEALSYAIDANNSVAIANCYYWLGNFYHTLDQKKEAAQSLRQARGAIDTVAGATRDRLLVDILDGQAQLGGESQDPVSLLTEAIELAEASRYRDHLVELYHHRAQAYRRIGFSAKAFADLETAIHLIEEWRSNITNWSYRREFFERERAVFDDVIDLNLHELRNPSRALEYLERSKARALMEVLATKYPREGYKLLGSTEDIVRNSPETTAFVFYRLIDGELCSWVVNGVGLHSKGCRNASDLSHLIDNFRRGLVEHRPEGSQAGTLLYQLLIEPLQPDLLSETRLVLVLDDMLCRIPFAALVEPRSGKYLIERYSLVYSPSASFYISSLKRAASITIVKDALVIAAPESSYKNFANLPRLEHASREALGVAALYPNPTVLLGKQATKAEVLRRLRENAIANFAVHAILNSEAPSWSSLILAPSTEDSKGAMYAWEVAQQRLENVHLVVLAACGSTEGVRVWMEGDESLGQAFLMAGVETVIGTMWPIDDNASGNLVIRIHRKLLEGNDTADALRSVQLDAIRRGEPANTWSSFQVVGASS